MFVYDYAWLDLAGLSGARGLASCFVKKLAGGLAGRASLDTWPLGLLGLGQTWLDLVAIVAWPAAWLNA
jgi:hypothetical protein